MIRRIDVVLKSALCLLLLCASACHHAGAAGSAPLEADSYRRAQVKTSAPRAMAYSASLSIEVDSFDGLDERVKPIVEDKKGFVATSSTSETGYSAELKVPSEHLQSVIDALAAFGEVRSKSIRAEDVTDRISDLDGKLKNLTALRDRYRLVLEKAKEMKDVLAVEQELNRIQGEIEQIESQLSGVQKRVAYSTLSFSAQQSTIYGPLGYLVQGTIWVVEKLFVIR